MTGYLPEYIIDELGKAQNKKLEKSISMKVKFNDKFYPIIKFSGNSFSINSAFKSFVFSGSFLNLFDGIIL